MAKQKSSLKYIFKIDSSRIRNSNWNLILPIDEAIKNEEIVTLADSSTLRFIREIEGLDDKYIEKNIKSNKRNIKKIKKEQTSTENRKKIKQLKEQNFNLLFMKSYVNIVMDTNKDFDRLNIKKGFYINGVKFKRLLATTGGAKNSTVIYVSELVYDQLNKRIDNGRNVEKPFVPAKLEAYKALTCSASIPVSNPSGVLVVNDCITKFKANVIMIDDTKTEYPIMTPIENYDMELNESDGYGLIHPELSKKWSSELGHEFASGGFGLRGSFAKGVLFSFDFVDFASSIAENNKVIDAWGNPIDIIEDNIQIILTTSMLKLWDSYTSVKDYLDNCKVNGYTFSITKIIPESLENERNLNYQFIQSLDLSDEDIEKLVEPTISEINDVLGGDWRKSLLFLKGMHLHDESFTQSDSDFSKALMADKNMINDPFVKTKIHNMIKKRINDAKTGVLKVAGNFSIVSGDPFSLAQSIFGLEVTGLLKSGEFYSEYWNDQGVEKVACFRAPMTCHNNIRLLRFKQTESMNHWYQYMNSVTIFNSWDTTAESLNTLDKDGDAVMTTSSEIIINAVEELDAIVCIQKTADKIVTSETDLVKANKNSFGDAIGSITNKITAMFDVRSKFHKDSEEYKELDYRIKCGQNYQQNAIDKSKGIISKSMPKDWYEYKPNIIEEGDDEETIKRKTFNLKILANKKPYFFSYIYPNLMRTHKTYLSNTMKNCYKRFGISINELFEKENKTDEENEFINYYSLMTPLSMEDSVMNKICRRIEEEFNGVGIKISEGEFDYSLLITDSGYSKSRYDAISDIYRLYVAETREYAINGRHKRVDKDERRNKRIEFVEKFKKDSFATCSNSEELTNIVVDICYKKGNNSKQFAWDICGKQIVYNLLKKNNFNVMYPIQDSNGDIDFGGIIFKENIKELEEFEFENSFR